ncbi:MAG: hypothetical protein K8T89_07410 [Planctomycetes bacterium]|nr:hypothetical protein [Planctomycetota bacterium]
MGKWRNLAAAGLCVLTASTVLAQPVRDNPFAPPLAPANANPFAQPMPPLNANPFAPTAPINSNPFAPPANRNVEFKYPVTQQAGEWLICVQTFKDEKALTSVDPNRPTRPKAYLLAEELAEHIRKEYKLPAYLYERSRKARAEEDERIRKLRKQYDDSIAQLRAQGAEPDPSSRFRVRTFDIQDEFAVLIGKPDKPLKDMEAASDFLKQVRKLKPLPEKFSMRAVIANDDETGKKVTQTGYNFINPFQTAMVVHNPAIPFETKQDNPEKADELLKKLNADETYNLLKCSKQWTLVVKLYQGQAQLQEPKSPSIMKRLGFGKKEPELLNASAAQAHSTAEFLRAMKFDAYVMHHRSYSIVTVGQYDSPDDPNLQANQKALAGMQLKAKGSIVALETLNAQPLPMKIPR